VSVLIRNGRVISPIDDRVADILVEGETISVIAQSLNVDATSIIDATGKWVLPGCVDPHTHIESAFLGVQSADDFTSGGVAAAFGGTTTIIEFCEPAPGQHLLDGLATWHQKFENARPVIDVGFHMIVDDLESDTLDVVRELAGQGVSSFKAFMAYKDSFMLEDESLFRLMEVIAETKSLLMVHAENGGAVEVLVENAIASGRREPKYHAKTRPVEIEAEATNRAIQLAAIAGCALYVVHVSCADALLVIERARSEERPVWGETCPHYLLFDDSVLDLPAFEGAKYVYSPPPRPREHLDALWQALRTGVLSVVSTDHSPYPFQGGKTLGRDDFSKIANGVGGIEERLMLLHHFGVRPGRISAQRMVELLATNPAKLFGLFPKKGAIAVGSDADIVIFDPSTTRTLSVTTQKSRCDYSIYEGIEVTGVPETVLVRGTPVILDGELVAAPGHGEFLRRHAPELQAESVSAFGGTRR
jgi:dihydropyrimidinase